MNTATVKRKNQTKNLLNQNPIESIRDIGQGIASSMLNDLAKPAVSDIWEQLLGINTTASGKT